MSKEPEWFQEVLDRTKQTKSFLLMWREGYDYPSDDDEQDDRDLLDRADEAHEQQNDK